MPPKTKTRKPAKKVEVVEKGIAIYNPDVAKLLHQITPKEFIDKHPFNGLDYVQIGYVRRCVEDFCKTVGGTWSYQVEEVGSMEKLLSIKQVVVRGTLTIILIDGTIMSREQFGGSEVKCYKKGHKREFQPMDLGNDYKAAASDAFKKCASSFGIAQDVFEPKVEKKVRAKAAQDAAKDEADAGGETPLAKTNGKYEYTDGDKITMEQMAVVAKIVHKSELADRAKKFLKDDLGGASMSRMTRGEYQQLLDWAVKNDLKDPPF